MPGAKGSAGSKTWFADVFGFNEGSYEETRSRFEFKDDVLISKANKASFHVGPFEMVSAAALRDRLAKATPTDLSQLGGLKFTNLLGDARTLHREQRNEGAVFQVASQFNCLEMVEPGVSPLQGITNYAIDMTQGPACAMACPAGTVFRNFFVNGSGQGHSQLDGLAEVAAMLENDRHKYWKMVNGYCLPCGPGSIAKLGQRLQTEVDPQAGAPLGETVASHINVGVHWDTQVASSSHRVCQVFCSAVPVAYAKSTPSGEWEPFARVALRAAFESTLLVGAALAQERCSRVTVYLTALGGGAFGNRSQWIIDAMQAAMEQPDVMTMPLDVKLVHFGTSLPRSNFQELEKAMLKKLKMALKCREDESKGATPGEHEAAASTTAKA